MIPPRRTFTVQEGRALALACPKCSAAAGAWCVESFHRRTGSLGGIPVLTRHERRRARLHPDRFTGALAPRGGDHGR